MTLAHIGGLPVEEALAALPAAGAALGVLGRLIVCRLADAGARLPGRQARRTGGTTGACRVPAVEPSARQMREQPTGRHGLGRRGIGEDAGMDTILAWLLPLVVFLVFLGILMRRRDGISGRDARLIIVAIVVCAAAAAALDVVL